MIEVGRDLRRCSDRPDQKTQTKYVEAEVEMQVHLSVLFFFPSPSPGDGMHLLYIGIFTVKCSPSRSAPVQLRLMLARAYAKFRNNKKAVRDRGQKLPPQPLLSTRLNFLAFIICPLVSHLPIRTKPLFNATTHLCPRPLSPHRQSHRMPPPPVRAHVPQPLDVVLQLPPRVVLQRHLRQLARQVVNLLLGQRAHARRIVDVEARHQFRAGLGPESVKAAQGF